MASVQVIVSKDSRNWDSIRDDVRSAMFRVGEHMRNTPGAVVAGQKLQSLVVFGNTAEVCAEYLQALGYTLTVKQLDNVNIIEGTV